MNLKPLYEKIVVKMKNKQEIKSSTGITYNLDFSKSANTILQGEVVAVGDGRLMSDGTLVPLKVKVGDTVIFSKMQGESYTDSENDYTILSESSILCIVAKEDLNENN